jgi:hypothetical protein
MIHRLCFKPRGRYWRRQFDKSAGPTDVNARGLNFLQIIVQACWTLLWTEIKLREHGRWAGAAKGIANSVGRGRTSLRTRKAELEQSNKLLLQES